MSIEESQGRGEPKNAEEKALLNQRMAMDRGAAVMILCLALACAAVFLLLT